MRATLLLSLSLALACQANPLKQAHQQVHAYLDTTSDVVSFLRGLTKGLTGEDLGADFGQCIEEGSGIVNELDAAVEALEAGNFTGVINSLFSFIQIVNEIPQVFSDCYTISGQAVMKLEDFAMRFSDINTLLHKLSMNMLFHGVEIVNDFN